MLSSQLSCCRTNSQELLAMDITQCVMLSLICLSVCVCVCVCACVSTYGFCFYIVANVTFISLVVFYDARYGDDNLKRPECRYIQIITCDCDECSSTVTSHNNNCSTTIKLALYTTFLPARLLSKLCKRWNCSRYVRLSVRPSVRPSLLSHCGTVSKRTKIASSFLHQRRV